MTASGTWIGRKVLNIAPYPTLGVRLDVYDLFIVDSVVVGDVGCDVTCIGRLEGAGEPTEATCRRLGFEEGPYP